MVDFQISIDNVGRIVDEKKDEEGNSKQTEQNVVHNMNAFLGQKCIDGRAESNDDAHCDAGNYKYTLSGLKLNRKNREIKQGKRFIDGILHEIVKIKHNRKQLNTSHTPVRTKTDDT